LLNIGLCDDEPAELESLRILVADYARRRQISFDLHCFRSGEGLLDAAAKGQAFDLLFLDIYMGSADGIAVAKKVREYDKACCIIFATNSREHAISGYGVRALQYLLKPLVAEEVEAALDQAIEARPGATDQCVQVKNRQGVYRILFSDIVFAESNAKIVTIHTRKDGDVSFYDRLDNFSLQCEDERFLRCHKSFLVNLDFVYAIVDNDFILKTGEEIRISISVAEAKKIFTMHAGKNLKP
jgi:two-component system, LytTR family, response regulator LytT